MCTTRRYLFLCSHPATHRFRNEICESPSVRGCRVQDYHVYLRQPCVKCQQRGMASVYTGEKEPIYEDLWHIPPRCFVDIGFQKLDPFEVNGTMSETSSVTSMCVRQSIDQDPLERPLTPTKVKNIQSNICRRFLRRLTLRKPSPCCISESINGGIEATRIEGRHYRIDGLIPARCVSPL
jgi:hypothetical protein